MKNGVHPRHLLEAFVAGQLGENENEAIIAHLTECKSCLEEADRLWSKRLDAMTNIHIPELQRETAERIEHSVIHRIHQTDLLGEAVRLGTIGLIASWQALIRPLLRVK